MLKKKGSTIHHKEIGALGRRLTEERGMQGTKWDSRKEL